VKVADLGRFSGMPSAALKAEALRHEGNSLKKKGPEKFRALVIGGAWLTTHELSIRTKAYQRVLERECGEAKKTQPSDHSYTGTTLQVTSNPVLEIEPKSTSHLT
jgi:hypothetical protein